MSKVELLEVVSPGSSSSSIDDDLYNSPERHASYFSQMLVTWLTPLLRLGYERPLEASDLPVLAKPFRAAYLQRRLASTWEIRRNQSGKWALLWALLDAFGRPFYLAGLLKLLGDACGLSSPVVLGWIIQDLKNPGKNFPYYGLGLCAAIFGLQMINTLSVNTYFTITMQSGLRVRTATSALVYNKALGLSGKARQAFSTGQIVNLMSTDAGRLDMAASYLHYAWSGPFQAIVILFLLFRLLSWAAFVGFAFLVLFIPVQSKITTMLSKYRKETSATTDKRVRLMQEIIQGIRVIKFYAWENSFLGKLFELREQELNRVKMAQTVRSLTVVLTSVTSIFSCIVTFVAYYLMGNTLTAEVVFPTLALFTLLRLPLVLLPMVISMAVDGAVSVKRLCKFLIADELDFVPELRPDGEFGLIVENGHFVWETSPVEVRSDGPTSKENLLDGMDEPRKDAMALEGINLRVPKGALVGIVGPVGAGKSSLLNALVGELKALSGRVVFGGAMAYCPQQAWIQNATVRDNILFGAPYDSGRYSTTVSACALLPDFAMLPDGDMTEIGEKGVNLSGGQKQRISLARATYSNVNVVLLDDPLSAVDAQVGRHLMQNCINGAMLGRTRLLVTHQLHMMPSVDLVVVMEGGKIVEQGSFEELMAVRGGHFSVLMRQHGGLGEESESEDKVLEGSPEQNSLSVAATTSVSSDQLCINSTVLKEFSMAATLTDTKALEALDKADLNGGGAKRITAAEERVVGAVEWRIYWDYLSAAGGVAFVVGALSSVIAWNVTRISTDWWIAMWTSATPVVIVTAKVFMAIYLGLGLLQGLFAVISGLSFSWGGIKAASTLHNRSAQRVIHAPVAFFDTNPTGRIINRFSKDQDTVDSLMPETLRSFVHTLGLTTFTLLTIVAVQWMFAVPLIALLILYYYVQAFYRRTSRELKRLEALSRSPLYAHFSETLSGLPTIRAFGQQSRFIQRSLTLLDINNRAAFMQLAIQRWLGIRLESVGNLIILAASSCCYFFNASPSLAGLIIAYSLSVTGVMNWCVRQFADTEAQSISSERLTHYAWKLPVERAIPLHPADVSPNWPEQGAIEFKHVTMRYRPDLPSVLQDVHFTVRPGERIGIVGRTGAGKSSIMQTLFRIVEPSEGSIMVDGIDTRDLELSRLRRSISIIPQDPVVFAGTLRWNLDPLGERSDAELWAALDRAHLKEAIKRMDLGLDASLQEGGENLSVGQRQLLCLARAILRRNKILVLDEATANVDLATDALLQAALRADFIGCTILTIAHRISTVIDYDRILVLDAGKIVEFDSPKVLQTRDSLFARLIRETGEHNEVPS
jgi:ABC-type multidrug transport system fused ATPase/permease subunit